MLLTLHTVGALCGNSGLSLCEKSKHVVRTMVIYDYFLEYSNSSEFMRELEVTFRRNHLRLHINFAQCTGVKTYRQLILSFINLTYRTGEF